MKLSELIEQLEELARYYEDQDRDPEVRLAFQPNWPLQHHVGQVVVDETSGQDHVVYIAEGGQDSETPYVPGSVAEELGWR